MLIYCENVPRKFKIADLGISKMNYIVLGYVNWANSLLDRKNGIAWKTLEDKNLMRLFSLFWGNYPTEKIHEFLQNKKSF